MCSMKRTNKGKSWSHHIHNLSYKPHRAERDHVTWLESLLPEELSNPFLSTGSTSSDESSTLRLSDCQMVIGSTRWRQPVRFPNMLILPESVGPHKTATGTRKTVHMKLIRCMFNKARSTLTSWSGDSSAYVTDNVVQPVQMHRMETRHMLKLTPMIDPLHYETYLVTTLMHISPQVWGSKPLQAENMAM